MYTYSYTYVVHAHVILRTLLPTPVCSRMFDVIDARIVRLAIRVCGISWRRPEEVGVAGCDVPYQNTHHKHGARVRVCLAVDGVAGEVIALAVQRSNT